MISLASSLTANLMYGRIVIRPYDIDRYAEEGVGNIERHYQNENR
ncbi:MAG: hypothetical protein O7D34_09630 [Ignavibacteria bacterium]|nr:hypothetical protein [Ignavibacteria bacterium]